METAIDVQNFPGHARGVVAEKEGCGFPDILAGDLPAQRGDSFLKGQLGVQPLDGRGGQGLDGSGAENVDTDFEVLLFFLELMLLRRRITF